MPRIVNQTKEPIVVEETGGGSAVIRPGRWVEIPNAVFDLVVRLRDVQENEVVVIGNRADRGLDDADREAGLEERGSS